MKLIRSILERINQFRSTPLGLELEGRWKAAFFQKEFSWFLLLMLTYIVLTTIFWGKERMDLANNLNLHAERVQHMRAIQKDPLQLGSKRLMGTPSPVSQIPERVQIQAILFNPDPNAREVLIMDASGQVKSYKQGDRLPGGSEIKDIQPQMIILERNGYRNEYRMNQYPNTFISDKPLQESNSILQ
jgi:type II secretory pathway component PulC